MIKGCGMVHFHGLLNNEAIAWCIINITVKLSKMIEAQYELSSRIATSSNERNIYKRIIVEG